LRRDNRALIWIQFAQIGNRPGRAFGGNCKAITGLPDLRDCQKIGDSG
jgi:hypothetical protein